MFLYVCNEDYNLPMMFEKLFIFGSYFVRISIDTAWNNTSAHLPTNFLLLIAHTA